MSLADSLLQHAELLATLDRRRPRVANLRRSVSASYYALFHLLTNSAASMYSADEATIAAICRTYNHPEMRRVSMLFANDKLPKAILPATGYRISIDLKIVAEAFSALQQARHDADCDANRIFTRREAANLARQARNAFSAWQRVRRTGEARLYLGCFLLWKRWDEEPR